MPLNIRKSLEVFFSGSNIGSAYSRNSEQFEYVDDKRNSNSDSGNIIASTFQSRFGSKKQAPPPPP